MTRAIDFLTKCLDVSGLGNALGAKEDWSAKLSSNLVRQSSEGDRLASSGLAMKNQDPFVHTLLRDPVGDSAEQVGLKGTSDEEPSRNTFDKGSRITRISSVSETKQLFLGVPPVWERSRPVILHNRG